MPQDEWAKGREKDAGRRELRRQAIEGGHRTPKKVEYSSPTQPPQYDDPVRSFEEWKKLIEESTRNTIRGLLMRIIDANDRNEVDRFGDLVKLVQAKYPRS